MRVEGVRQPVTFVAVVRVVLVFIVATTIDTKDICCNPLAHAVAITASNGVKIPNFARLSRRIAGDKG